MAGILEGSDSFTGINWWIGQVAPRETLAENTLLKNDANVGTAARKTMQNFFKKKIFLGLFVKVAKDWRSRKSQLKKFGYN